MTLPLGCENLHTRTYLLRLWREHEAAPWRAALRPTDGGAPLGFGDLEALADFLLRLTEDQPSADDTDEVAQR